MAKKDAPLVLCKCGCGNYALPGRVEIYRHGHKDHNNKGIPHLTTRGANNPMARPEIRAKQKANQLIAMTPAVHAKIKATLMEHYGVDNYSKTDEFKNLIRLENHPNWKGGITNERAAFYARAVWKEIAKKVWWRDAGTCQKCKMHQSEKENAFNIHHIIDFEVVELRDDIDNLVLLCRECHSFVHSKKNNEREYRVAIQT